MADARTLLTGWGRTAPTGATVVVARSVDDVVAAVRSAGTRGVLPRGLGRSYGDAAQNAGGTVIDLRPLDTIGAVDPAIGELTVAGGASLDEVLARCVPAGWFVPVTPGTRQVTLGGAIAADIHGKNHHRDGSIGRHVTALELVDGRGDLRRLTPADELFQATVGGLGLTGVITSVTLRMIPIESSWIAVDTWRTADLEETMSRLLECDTSHRYSVAWIDCLAVGARLGRGVVTAGDHLPASALPAAAAGDPLRYGPRSALPAPPFAPRRLLARPQVRAFNEAYHRRAPRAATAVPTPLSRFFHPLDGVADWNRLYGGRGFVQYQFVTQGPAPVADVLRSLAAAGAPGLLAVLKRFGPGSGAPLSFPTAGWTLAVDIPADVDELSTILDRADRMVLEAGGRLYLAKDARTAPDALRAMYPDLDRWRMARAASDPGGIFRSDLARRLEL